MARTFARASSQFLQADSAPLTAAPFTVSMWLWSSDGANNKVALYLGDKDNNTSYWRLLVTTNETLRFTASEATATNCDSAAAAFGLSAWNHVTAVERGAADRELYLAGASVGTNTTSKSPAGSDRISLGQHGGSTPGTFWDGLIAEVGIWNVALNTDEISALSKGVSPLLIRPTALVFYAPLVRDEDRDLKGISLIPTGTPTVGDHPRMFWAAGLHIGQAVASGTGYTQSVAGTLTSAGTAAKSTTKSPGGTLASAGALFRAMAKALAGALTSTGALVRNTIKTFAGTLTSAGALTTVRIYLASLTGTLTSAGTLTRQAQKSLAGTLTSAGALIKSAAKAFAGTLTSSGALATIRTFLVSLAGTLTSAGGLAKQTNKALAGTLTSAGSLARGTLKSVAGTLSSGGTVNKAVSKFFAGALSSIGTLVSALGGAVVPGRVALSFSEVTSLSLTFAEVYRVAVSEA